MAKVNNSYYVLYVEECSPKIKKFTSKSTMNSFMTSFINKYGSIDDKNDNWIDHVFYGKKMNVAQFVTVKVQDEAK